MVDTLEIAQSEALFSVRRYGGVSRAVATLVLSVFPCVFEELSTWVCRF